jgi:peptide deformylase
MFAFQEGCLSFPNKSVVTSRHKRVIIEADNHTGKLFFDYSPPANSPKDYNNTFETACVQHEIDHLDGITMFDREIKKQEPVKNQVKKIGRNDKVLIACGTESKVMKYKKAEPLLNDGWTLVEA